MVEAALPAAAVRAGKPALPKGLPDRVAAIRAMLAEAEEPVSAPELARRFSQGRRAERKVAEVLRALALLG